MQIAELLQLGHVVVGNPGHRGCCCRCRNRRRCLLGLHLLHLSLHLLHLVLLLLQLGLRIVGGLLGIDLRLLLGLFVSCVGVHCAADSMSSTHHYRRGGCCPHKTPTHSSSSHCLCLLIGE